MFRFEGGLADLRVMQDGLIGWRVISRSQGYGFRLEGGLAELRVMQDGLTGWRVD